MNALLALSFEPAWLGYVAVFLGPAAIVFTGWVYSQFDKRYERKDTAEEKAVAVAKARQEEVEHLKAADARIEALVGELSATVKAQDQAAQISISSLRSEMNTGFEKIRETITVGFLALTKDVAQMQGRLAGAAGVVKQDNG